jgi:RNA polymerase-binding transcription factor DksA
MNAPVALARPRARREVRERDPRRDSLLAELAAQRCSLAECDAALDDLARSADREDADARAVMRHLRTRALEAIVDIERTLVRIDDGTYESCARCAGPIGDSRLAALPLTTFCIRCASTTDCRT